MTMHTHAPRRRTTVAIMTAMLLVAGLGTAYASHTNNTSGQVDRGGATANYTTERTISESGADIYMELTSSPPGGELLVKWRLCDNPSVDGGWRSFTYDGDDETLGTGFVANTRFCLSARRAHGTWWPGADTWHGTVAWDFHSNPFVP